jgi:hypothetical protein
MSTPTKEDVALATILLSGKAYDRHQHQGHEEFSYAVCLEYPCVALVRVIDMLDEYGRIEAR